MAETQQFACLNGHQFMAWNEDGSIADLANHFCPLCLGAVIGEVPLDSRILAPVQASLPPDCPKCGSPGGSVVQHMCREGG